MPRLFCIASGTLEAEPSFGGQFLELPLRTPFGRQSVPECRPPPPAPPIPGGPWALLPQEDGLWATVPDFGHRGQAGGVTHIPVAPAGPWECPPHSRLQEREQRCPGLHLSNLTLPALGPWATQGDSIGVIAEVITLIRSWSAGGGVPTGPGGQSLTSARPGLQRHFRGS